jgi:HSP20 family protein|tara:strand:- start:1606 stop:2082 length:477 start_codon:yes stop_codon:yes gene_type:complete
MTTLSVFRPRNNRELNSLLKERDHFIRSFDTIFDDMFKTHFGELGVSAGKGAYPKVNVISHTDRVDIIAELAGFTKTDIDLEIDEDLLTISGKSPQKDDNQQTYYLRELKRSSFRRSFKINDNVAMDNVSAKFDNGLLTISLPRVKEEVKEAKKVTIS